MSQNSEAAIFCAFLCTSKISLGFYTGWHIKSEIFSYGILKKDRTIDRWNKRFQHRQGFRRLRIHLLQSTQDGKEDEDLGGSEGRGMG